MPATSACSSPTSAGTPSCASRMSRLASGRDGRNERAESLPLPGSIYEQVLFSQELAVIGEAGGWLVLLPVTERGDAIGLLELSLPHPPDTETVALPRVRGPCPGLRPHRLTTPHRRLRVGPARPSVLPLGGDPTPAAPFLLHRGGRSVHARRLARARQHRRRRHLRLLARTGVPVRVDHRRHGPFKRSRNAGHADRRQPPQQPAGAGIASATGQRRQRRPAGRGPARPVRDRTADPHPSGGRRRRVRERRPPAALPGPRGAGRRARRVIAPPLGITEIPYETQEFRLEPGDRLLLLTDGFLERNAVVDLPRILAGTETRHPREVVRELAASILQVTGGKLQDDATVVCIDWYGPDRERKAIGGASRERATDT